jgi:phage shock protein E
MKSELRAAVVAHLLLLCPVLFTACGGKPAESTTPAARVESQPVSTPSAATPPTDATTVRHVDVAGAKKLLADGGNVVVLDVRTPEEFAGGHVAGATNLDFNSPDFRDHLSKLDRDKTYLVHCAAGGRSTRSLSRFKDLGFKSVVHLDGGFNGWVEAGLPVAK